MLPAAHWPFDRSGMAQATTANPRQPYPDRDDGRQLRTEGQPTEPADAQQLSQQPSPQPNSPQQPCAQQPCPPSPQPNAVVSGRHFVALRLPESGPRVSGRAPKEHHSVRPSWLRARQVRVRGEWPTRTLDFGRDVQQHEDRQLLHDVAVMAPQAETTRILDAIRRR